MSVLDEIQTERKRQRTLKHGGDTDELDRKNTQNDWVAYVCAYAGRASGKVSRNDREGQDFRANMIKVGALAVAAVEAYDNDYC